MTAIPRLSSCLAILLLGFIIALPSTQLSGQNYSGKQKDIDQILANVAQFSTDLVAGNTEGVVGSYTSDGKIFPTNRDIMEGTEALQQYWKRAPGTAVTYHKITPLEISITKKTAYDYGYYEGTSRNAEGEEFDFKGKYVIIWKKIDGDWKIYMDIWNRIAD